MEKLYSIKEAAEVLQIHPDTMRRYARTGKIRAAIIGKGFRITESDLKAFIEQRTKEINQ